MIDNTPITRVATTRFLGVLLDESLSWKPHIRSIKTKMAKSIGILGKTRHLINYVILLYGLSLHKLL